MQSASSSTTHKSIFQKIFKIALSGGYSQLITLLIQFIQIPLFLKFWNKEVYTDWLIITGLPTLLTLLDLGICQVSASKATMQGASGQWDDSKKSINTALMFTSCLSLLLLVTVFFLSQSINFADVFELHHFNETNAELILLVMTAYLVINLHGGPTDAVFRTMNQAAYGLFLISNRRLVDFLIAVVALYCGAQPLTLALLLLFGQIFYLGWILYETKKADTYGLLSYSKASRSEFQSILKPSIAYMGFPVSQMITTQGGVQLLNAFGAAYLVVPFTMTRTLVRTVIQMATILNTALKPELSRLIGSGKMAEAQIFTRKLSLYASIFALFWYAFLILIGPWFVEQWSRHLVEVQRLTIALVGLHALFNVFWFVSAAYSIAGNKHSRLSTVYSLSSVMAMIVWILFKDAIPPLYGVCAMMLLPELAASIYSYCASRKNPLHS